MSRGRVSEIVGQMIEPVFNLSVSPRVYQLTIQRDPSSFAIVAKMTVCEKGRIYLIELVNPQPLHDLMDSFDCYELKVFDRRADQLEFGRYRLEIWDEDGATGAVIADGFSYEVAPQTRQHE